MHQFSIESPPAAPSDSGPEDSPVEPAEGLPAPLGEIAAIDEYALTGLDEARGRVAETVGRQAVGCEPGLHPCADEGLDDLGLQPGPGRPVQRGRSDLTPGGVEMLGLPALYPFFSVGAVPHFASARDACVAAAGAERDNISLYDHLLTLALPNDVRQVFTNNRRASIDNHQPAFIACS